MPLRSSLRFEGEPVVQFCQSSEPRLVIAEGGCRRLGAIRRQALGDESLPQELVELVVRV